MTDKNETNNNSSSNSNDDNNDVDDDDDEKQAFQIMEKLVKIAPHFGFSIFERYVKAYCENKLDDLLPFTVENVSKSTDNSAQIQMELLEGFSKLSKLDRDQTIDFLKKID